MDRKVVKLQIRVFWDGEEERAFSQTIDIVKTQGPLWSSLSIPSNLDEWVRNAVKALYEGRKSFTQFAPDAELMRSINIVDPSQTPMEVNVQEPDINAQIVFDENLQADIPTNEQNPDIILIQASQDDVSEEEPLDISVPSFTWSDEQEKKQLRVIVRQAALDKAQEHAQHDTSRETGGVMLGMFFEDETTITVVFTGIVRALSAVRETSSVKFTSETWAEIWQAIDQDKEYTDENVWNIVGWYHTHPDFGVFLSSFDKFIQKEYFTRKGHLALVIDPVRKERDFFVTNKETGETPNLDQKFITYVKSDKVLLKELNKMQAKVELKQLPPIEVSIHKGD